MELLVFKILVIIVGLYMAWNIGANDVANAMGTSVGSRIINIKTAVILAGIFEFLGATLVGSSVTNTIRKGIIDIHLFKNMPEIFMIGMLASLLGAAIWLQIATYFKLPVSTTHAIVGAVIGFGILINGFHSVHWVKVWQIVASWVISPISGAVLSFLMFKFILIKIIDTNNPAGNAKKWGPYLIALVIFILYLVLIFKGLKNVKLGLSITQIITIGLFISLFFFVISHMLFKRVILKKGKKYENVEKIFGYLQIVTACSVAFSHGANDVANATGPMAAVLGVLKDGYIAEKTTVMKPVLFLGGIGIVIGLATWGYKVIETIGHNITEITPSRGFSAEFGAATTVLVCSKLGMPISTTHTLVGAVMGIGLARGLVAINMKTVKNIIYSWILTIPAAAFFTVIIFYILKALFPNIPIGT